MHKVELLCDLYGEHLGWVCSNHPMNLANKMPTFCTECLEQDPKGCEQKTLEMLSDH